MAAVVARIVCLPCEALSSCCAPLCEMLGGLVVSICKFFDRPFSCFAFIAVLFNMPLMALCLAGAARGSSICPSKILTWLGIEAALYLANIVISIYLFVMLSKPYVIEIPTDRDFNSRLQYLLCYDKVVAFYITVGIFLIIWQIIGSVWSNDCSLDCQQNDISYGIGVAAFICMWTYLVIQSGTFIGGAILSYLSGGGCNSCWRALDGMMSALVMTSTRSQHRRPRKDHDIPQTQHCQSQVPSHRPVLVPIGTAGSPYGVSHHPTAYNGPAAAPTLSQQYAIPIQPTLSPTSSRQSTTLPAAPGILESRQAQTYSKYTNDAKQNISGALNMIKKGVESVVEKASASSSEKRT